MNAERLHAIAVAVLEDLKATKSEETLKQLVGALQNAVNQPNAPQFQQQISEFRTALKESLLTAPSNNFSPAWKQALKELGLQELLGENLQARIEEIFSHNQITTSIAFTDIQKIYEQLTNHRVALEHIVSGLKQMSIGEEKLEPGQCEVGVLVPRSEVHNKLAEFADELEELNQIFGVFSELTTGKRPGFEIRSVSSSDLSIFVMMIPLVAHAVVDGLDKIINIYKNLLVIRKHYGGLKDGGVPPETLDKLQEYIDKKMADGIKEIAKELMEANPKVKDPNRRGELETELEQCLTKIAKRIDRAYSFEVRVQPVPEEEGGKKKVADEDRARIDEILAVSKSIEFLKLEGKPILTLPESQGDHKDKKERSKGGGQETEKQG